MTKQDVARALVERHGTTFAGQAGIRLRVKLVEGAKRVGLPTTPDRLASYVDAEEFPNLTAARLRASRSSRAVEDVRG